MLKLRILLLGILATLSCHQLEPTKVQLTNEGVTSKENLRQDLIQLMNPGYQKQENLNFSKIQIAEKEDHILYRVVIRPVPKDSIPAYLLIPKGGAAPYPVMICLQGHAPGMYISIGESRTDRDQKLIAGGRDIALQAIQNGWAALTVEQRGFGEQAVGDLTCNHVSLNGAMKGQPMIGKRVADIQYAIDFLETQKELQLDNLGCMGNSAGGTVSYFAACVDTRIQLAVVSCSFCTYERSWLKYPHCACGYLPGLLTIADMPDLAKLIAPRYLLIIAGKEDYLADIQGVREGFLIAKNDFREENIGDHILLKEGNGGHQFYPDLAWPQINHFKNNQRFLNE